MMISRPVPSHNKHPSNGVTIMKNYRTRKLLSVLVAARIPTSAFRTNTTCIQPLNSQRAAQTRRPHGTTIAPTVRLGSIRDMVTALKIIGRFLRHKIDNSLLCTCVSQPALTLPGSSICTASSPDSVRRNVDCD